MTCVSSRENQVYTSPAVDDNYVAFNQTVFWGCYLLNNLLDLPPQIPQCDHDF